MGKEARSVKVEYEDPPPAPLLDANEFYRWSFYRSIVAEFVATLLLLYVTVATVIGNANDKSPCGGVGNLGIAWSFGGMIFVLVYCTAGISGGHLNPAVTFGLFVARKVTLNRTVLYMVAQCLGAICGAGMVKALQKTYYSRGGGGANSVSTGFANGTALAAEIVGTFVLVYTVFCSMDPKSNARDAHVPSDYFVRKWDVRLALDDFYTSLGYLALAPLSIGFAVFLVHLATIPITGTGINPARSFGAAVIYGHKKSWDDHWIFWVGPLIGATVAAAFHKYVIRANIKWYSKEPNHV